MLGESELAAAARIAVKQGNWPLAESHYAALLQTTSYQAEASSYFAYRRFVEERYEEACDYAERVLRNRTDDQAKLNLALAQLGAGHHAAADHTLKSLANTELAFAHLARSGLHAQDPAETIKHFEAFLRQQTSPTNLQTLPPLLAALITKGNALRATGLRKVHEQVLHAMTQEHGSQSLRRISTAIEHFHGNTQPWQHPLQRPSFFYVPDLEAQPWFERERFSWVAEIEVQHRAISAEYHRYLAQQERMLKPYVTAEQHAPIQSWGHLIDTEKWLSLHLLKGGKPAEPNASQMPVTLAALASCNLPQCQGNAPEAFFSTLAPKTHIPPHYGLANFKLVVHLALRIPDDCGIRVGEQTRHWQVGQCCIFDDSFLHEAWNHSTEHRTVLIFDTWHPDLSPIERHTISQLFLSIDAFYHKELSALM